MDENLLIRYLIHRCSPEEINKIDEWIAAGQANGDWLFEMERIWGLKDELRFSEKKEIEAAYNRFISELEEKEIVQKPNRRSFPLSWIKYAAAILLIGLLSTNLYFLLKEQPERMNVVEVPNGQRASLTLSDGTKVWLNSQSKLTYPAQFSLKKRDVKLEGEGFFEVSRNEKLPFTVHTNFLKIKVLGTKFNVKTYKQETSFVTLAEGEVEVSTNDDKQKVALLPNQQVSYSENAAFAVDKNVNTAIVNAWLAGEAAYVNKRLDEITRDLERKFDVYIEILDEELSAEIFTCRFKGTATIRQVLLLLKETRKLDYKIRGDHIQMYKPLNE